MKQDKKIAYLTIDDSPSANFLNKLEYLKSKQIPAIFFCIGQLLEQYPEAAIASIQAGYPMENHSYSHPHFSDLNLDEARFEIEKTDAIIEELYQKAGVKRKQKLFRFPYGDKGDKRYGLVLKKGRKFDEKRHAAIQAILRKNGYTQPEYKDVNYRFMKKAGLWKDADMSWSFDVMEWATFEKKPTFGINSLGPVIQRLNSRNPKDCRGRIWFEKRWLASPHSEIILLHDHPETDDIFNDIVDELGRLPLQFKSL